MPLNTAPNLIEMSDFTGGWQPDVEPGAVPPNAVLDVLNLLPDPASGALQVRKGFAALTAALAESGFVVQTVVPYNRLNGDVTERRLMVVCTNGAPATANNVRVFAIDLSDGSSEQVSPTTKSWASPNAHHWGATINGIYYGGGPKDQMYAWDPDGGWQDNPSQQTTGNNDKKSDDNKFYVWVDTMAPGKDERAYNFAFRKGDQVLYTDPVSGTQKAYSAAKDNRFSTWKSGTTYQKGDKVSRKADWGSGKTYYRSYKAKQDHDATDANEPGSGSGMWDNVNLETPVDDDGNVSDDWDLIPTAAVTNIAVWHGERLWMRYDNVKNTLGLTRLQFSAPSKPVKKSDIGEVQWDPADFRVTPVTGSQDLSAEGEGGGWLDVRTGDGDPITCLVDYGDYLLVFKRESMFVLEGVNEATWVFRQLADVGCVGDRAVVQHQGVVYFLSDQGLYVTDGSTVQEVDGAQHIRAYLRGRLASEIGAAASNLITDGDFESADDLTTNWDASAAGGWTLNTTSNLTHSGKHSAKRTGTGTLQDNCFIRNKDHVACKSGDVLTATAWVGAGNNSLNAEAQATVGISFFDVNDKWLGSYGAASIHPTGTQFQVGGGTGQPSSQWGPTWKSVTRSATAPAGTAYARPYVNINQHSTGSVVFDDVTLVNALANTRSDHSAADVSMWSYDGLVWCAFPSADAGTDPKTVVYDPRSKSCWLTDLPAAAVATTPDESGLHAFFSMRQGDSAVYEYRGLDDASVAIPWRIRTSWFLFGVLREERRVRRAWALVRGAVSMTLSLFRNFSDTAAATVTQTGPTTAGHIEGRVMPDAFTASVEVSGSGPAAFLGVALDTQPRRVRYHV